MTVALSQINFAEKSPLFQAVTANFTEIAREMTKANFIGKRIFIQNEKKLEKKHTRILLGLMTFGIIYYFIEPKTIGHDNQYLIYIFVLPTIVGMLILGFYRLRFLINRFSTNRGIVLWTFMTFYYLTQGIVFSYLSFGQIAKVSWDYFNNQTLKQNTEEIINCRITRFWTGKNPSIDFMFNNRNESIKLNYSTLKKYENKNVNDYNLKINVTKGLWNYYNLNEWNIEHK